MRSGISLPTYRRLERKEMDNPGIRYLANAALALGSSSTSSSRMSGGSGWSSTRNDVHRLNKRSSGGVRSRQDRGISTICASRVVSGSRALLT